MTLIPCLTPRNDRVEIVRLLGTVRGSPHAARLQHAGQQSGGWWLLQYHYKRLEQVALCQEQKSS